MSPLVVAAIIIAIGICAILSGICFIVIVALALMWLDRKIERERPRRTLDPTPVTNHTEHPLDPTFSLTALARRHPDNANRNTP
jgi:hypothetical protein